MSDSIRDQFTGVQNGGDIYKSNESLNRFEKLINSSENDLLSELFSQPFEYQL